MKDRIVVRELIKLRKKTALVCPYAEDLSEIKELAGFSPFVYTSFLTVLILSVFLPEHPESCLLSPG